MGACELLGTCLPQAHAPRFSHGWLKISSSPRDPPSLVWWIVGCIEKMGNTITYIYIYDINSLWTIRPPIVVGKIISTIYPNFVHTRVYFSFCCSFKHMFQRFIGLYICALLEEEEPLPYVYFITHSHNQYPYCATMCYKYSTPVPPSFNVIY